MTDYNETPMSEEDFPAPPSAPEDKEPTKREEEGKKVDYSKVSSQAGLQTFIHAGNIIRR